MLQCYIALSLSLSPLSFAIKHLHSLKILCLFVSLLLFFFSRTFGSFYEPRKFQRLKSDLNDFRFTEITVEQNMIWWARTQKHSTASVCSLLTLSAMQKTGKAHCIEMFLLCIEILFKSLESSAASAFNKTQHGVAWAVRVLVYCIILYNHSISCFVWVHVKPFSSEFTSRKTALFGYEVTASSPWLQQVLIKARLRFISRGLASYV